MTSNGSTPDNPHDTGAANSDAPPESSASASKSSIRKDRACPFCHQSFTSSSLGRHLDFFIREKNPKAPDGIHDVHQIRKMRENITRRHTRVPSGAVVDNSSRRWSVTSIASPKTTGPKHQTPVVPARAVPAPVDHNTEERPSWGPKNNWTASGVISDLPPRAAANPLPRILPRPDVKRSPLAHPYGNVEENDDARAAELALKEVLRTIKGAASRAQKPASFDFDFYASNFPSLCLHLLPAPATLFSTTPMAGPACWPLSIPMKSQLIALQDILVERFRTFRQDLENDVAAPAKKQAHPSLYSPEAKGHFDHLEAVYLHWQGFPDQQKLELWHVEMLRAYAQESEKKKTLQQRFDKLQADTERLQAQVDDVRTRQRSWQWQAPPPDISRSATPRLPTSYRTLTDSAGIDLHDWDYDRLIAKYKPTVQKTRRQSAATLATNNIRNAHERALPAFGPSDSLLLRPIMPPHGSSEGQLDGDTPGAAYGQGSEGEEDSQDEEGEWDEDVDMEDPPHTVEAGASRRFIRQGAG